MRCNDNQHISKTPPREQPEVGRRRGLAELGQSSYKSTTLVSHLVLFPDSPEVQRANKRSRVELVSHSSVPEKEDRQAVRENPDSDIEMSESLQPVSNPVPSSFHPFSAICDLSNEDVPISFDGEDERRAQPSSKKYSETRITLVENIYAQSEGNQESGDMVASCTPSFSTAMGSDDMARCSENERPAPVNDHRRRGTEAVLGAQSKRNQGDLLVMQPVSSFAPSFSMANQTFNKSPIASDSEDEQRAQAKKEQHEMKTKVRAVDTPKAMREQHKLKRDDFKVKGQRNSKPPLDTWPGPSAAGPSSSSRSGGCLFYRDPSILTYNRTKTFQTFVGQQQCCENQGS